eukprot:6191507-Pleurochrysis_carterae.AAC.1
MRQKPQPPPTAVGEENPLAFAASHRHRGKGRRLRNLLRSTIPKRRRLEHENGPQDDSNTPDELRAD